MADITVWSNSKLDTLTKCGEKFRRRYIEKEEAPPTLSALSGKAVHRVAATINTRRMNARKSVPVDAPRAFASIVMNESMPKRKETMELADAAFDEELKQGVSGSGKSISTAKQGALSSSVVYAEKVAPDVTPIGVEKHIEVSTADGTVVHGIIDLIDDTETGTVIRDLKTSGRKPPANAAEKSQQLTFYTMLQYAATGVLPSASVLDYVYQDASGKILQQSLRTSRNLDDVSAVAERINMAIASVNAGIFMPAPVDSWWCDPRYCEFYQTCRYAQKKNGTR